MYKVGDNILVTSDITGLTKGNKYKILHIEYRKSDTLFRIKGKYYRILNDHNDEALYHESLFN